MQQINRRLAITYVPDAVILSEGLTAYEKLCYLVLAKHAGKDARAWPGMATIAKYAGISRDSVKRALKGLHDKGWISVTKRTDPDNPKRNYSNLYTLTDGQPAGAESTQQGEGVGAESTQGGGTQHLGVGAESTRKDSQEEGLEREGDADIFDDEHEHNAATDSLSLVSRLKETQSQWDDWETANMPGIIQALKAGTASQKQRTMAESTIARCEEDKGAKEETPTWQPDPDYREGVLFNSGEEGERDHQALEELQRLSGTSGPMSAAMWCAANGVEIREHDHWQDILNRSRAVTIVSSQHSSSTDDAGGKEQHQEAEAELAEIF
jgi:DNA-binding MarR family transcriptional regulator